MADPITSITNRLLTVELEGKKWVWLTNGFKVYLIQKHLESLARTAFLLAHKASHRVPNLRACRHKLVKDKVSLQTSRSLWFNSRIYIFLWAQFPQKKDKLVTVATLEILGSHLKLYCIFLGTQ